MAIVHEQAHVGSAVPDHIWRRLGLGFIFVWFFVGGIGHFAATQAFVSVVPPYAPNPRFWVLFTGVAELAGAIGILIPRIRRLAGLGLIGLAICVTPANLEMALHAARYAIAPRALWLRLAFQPVLLWIIWRSTRTNSAVKLWAH